MSVRSELAAALANGLPNNVRVIDFPKSLDGIEANRPVVMLYRDRLAKAPNAVGTYLSTMSVWVITPKIDTARAEDALDSTLDAVVSALDGVPWALWSTADRTIFGDAQAPAYRIDVQVATNKE